jgi:hypothetical protein
MLFEKGGGVRGIISHHDGWGAVVDGEAASPSGRAVFTDSRSNGICRRGLRYTHKTLVLPEDNGELDRVLLHEFQQASSGKVKRSLQSKACSLYVLIYLCMPPGASRSMKPLNAARLYDLGPNVRINVVCQLCKRGNSMPADSRYK